LIIQGISIQKSRIYVCFAAEIEDICSHTMKQSGANKRPRSSGDQPADEMDELDE
jgi:hypothetical protein